MEKKNINEMFDNLDSSSLKVSETKESQSRKLKSKLIISISAGLLAIASLGAYYISNQTTVEVDKSSKVVSQEKPVRTNEPKVNPNSNELPVNLPDWLGSYYLNSTEGDYYNKLISSLDNTDFYYLTDAFPSVAEGFTSDKDKMYEEDGLPNIYYTTATKESIKFYTIQYLNRLFNPIFGGWTEYQYGKEFKTSELSSEIYEDMFSDKYIEANKNSMPFYTDKEGNDYGYEWSNKNTVPRFIGVVTGVSNLETDESLTSIKIEANVSVYGNTKEEQVQKDYDVVMTLIYDENKENSFVIDNIELKEK